MFLRYRHVARQKTKRGKKSYNLLQKAETVGDLIDVEVRVLPRVNVDTLLSALKHPQGTLLCF